MDDQAPQIPDSDDRPAASEPNGPLEGLVSAAADDVKEEATAIAEADDAEALLAQMGVEDEGIASGQLLGLVAATLVAVGSLAVVLIYLFYVPFKTQVSAREAGEARNTDYQVLRTEALAKITDYTLADSTYGLPISRAMGLVALEYGAADAEGLPDTRQEWNLLEVPVGMGTAVQPVSDRGAIAPRDLPAGDGDEQVGVDADDVDAIDPDADPDTIE